MDGRRVSPAAGVDARVAQLQHALSSRIVVEQAKGILAERYALTPDEAYELIRLAARSHGIKVHELSEAVRVSRQTPALILDLFTRPRSNAAPARAVENVFREANGALLKLAVPRFICECADASCTDQLEVSPETMHALHEDGNLYAVKAAHVHEELEQVVADHETFVVVRKRA